MGTLGAMCLLSACNKSSQSTGEDKETADYFKKLASQKDIIADGSGLFYKILTPAPKGASPTKLSSVKVHYEGRLLDGTVFDSSYERGMPAVFGLDGIIKGWQVALLKMKKGEVWEIHVPYQLAYGESGMPPKIPARAILIFKIELIDFQ